jgi:hypothetical protein
VGYGVILGVKVGSGVDVTVAVLVGAKVAVSVGEGGIVTVGGTGVAVMVSDGNAVDCSTESHPEKVRARTASPIRTGSPLWFQHIIMGAIIPLW